LPLGRSRPKARGKPIDRHRLSGYGRAMTTRCQISILIITLLFGGRSVLAKDPTGQYVWPLEGKTNLSSGFCDYRQQHYHGGIDISTDGREGIPVRAADSGHVMRIST